MTRLVLLFSDEPDARETLSNACRAHLGAGFSASVLQVALIPGVDSWLDASAFVSWAASSAAAASGESAVALAHRLVGCAPADAWLELSWHTAGAPTEQAGLAPYGAWTHAVQRGMRCHVTLVSGAEGGEAAGSSDAPARPSTEHWCQLLLASRLCLPTASTSAAAAALTDLLEAPCHWRGSVRLPGAEIDGVRLCPCHPAGCAGAPLADPTEAPLAGRPQLLQPDSTPLGTSAQSSQVPVAP